MHTSCGHYLREGPIICTDICSVYIYISIHKKIIEISPNLHLCCFPNPDSCTQAFPLGRRTCDLYLLPVPTAVASWWAAVSAHASLKSGLCFQLLCQGFDDTNIDGSNLCGNKTWKSSYRYQFFKLIKRCKMQTSTTTEQVFTSCVVRTTASFSAYCSRFWSRHTILGCHEIFSDNSFQKSKPSIEV